MGALAAGGVAPVTVSELIAVLEELRLAYGGDKRVVAAWEGILGELEQPVFESKLKVVLVDVDNRRYFPKGSK